MARKKKKEEHENHERWLVSYADFITLLFAFFVVMYSVSSVNEGKYRVLSESMVAAFRTSARALQPIQVGNLARTPKSATAPMQVPRPLNFRPIILDPQQFYPYGQGGMESNENEWKLDEAAMDVENLAKEMEELMEPLIAEELVTVRKNRLSLEVEINTSILFASGGAEPSVDAEIILKKVADLLAEKPNRIHVEGFTDSLPISNSQYPSNWELSSSRAAAVVRLFQRFRVEPNRMASIGYGEFRPIADNNTIIGRARNRRVVIVILANNVASEGEEPSYTDMEILSDNLNPDFASSEF